MVTPAVPTGGRDPGLQPERTALAWQRTGLAVVAGSLLGARLLSARVGAPALGLGAGGVLLGLGLLVAAGLRARRAAAGHRPGGAFLAVVAAACLALALAGLAVVVLL